MGYLFVLQEKKKSRTLNKDGKVDLLGENIGGRLDSRLKPTPTCLNPAGGTKEVRKEGRKEEEGSNDPVEVRRLTLAGARCGVEWRLSHRECAGKGGVRTSERVHNAEAGGLQTKTLMKEVRWKM